MNKFSAGRAAFAIFDFAKHNRGFVLKYIGLYALFVLAAFSGVWSIGYFDLFEIFMSVATDEAATTQAINNWSTKITPLIWLFMLACIGLWVIYASAVWRKMLRGEEVGFHGLRWGKDENQLALSFLVYYALNIGFNLVFVFAFLIGSALVAGIYVFAPPLAMLIGVIMVFVAIASSLVFFIRISQFGVLTIATRKMATIDSFTETRGHFWSFFGAYFIQSIIVLPFMMVLFGFMVWVGFGLYPENGVTPSDLSWLYQPQMLVFIGIFALIAGAFSIARLCIGAYAYKVMHEGEELPAEPEATPHIWPTLGE